VAVNRLFFSRRAKAVRNPDFRAPIRRCIVHSWRKLRLFPQLQQLLINLA
jgi:hypothetical protein